MLSPLKGTLLILVIIISISASGQPPIEKADLLAGRLIKELRSNSKEKIFVQTNKWFYAAGEELWMKAYIVNGLSHKYYSRSTTLYAELVDEKDTVVRQLLLNIPRQQTEALMQLPATLPEGYYWLRVYTADMLRQSKDDIFVLPLYVMNNRYPANLKGEASIKTIQPDKDNNPELVFFPEGGSLISGTNSQVGYKATDKHGNPLAIEGYITDMRDSIVSRFKTNQDGLGSSSIYVFKSRKYTAHVKWNNKDLEWTLPAINQYASQISVKEQDAYNLKVMVAVGDSLYKKNKTYYLLGVSRDSLCFAAVGTDMFEAIIPKNNFPEGRANLLLFNDQQEVVSERAVYIEKAKDEIVIKTDKEIYNPRDKVIVTIATGDSILHPALSALSVAVTDDNLIEDPGFALGNPFNNSNTRSNDEMDLVMLTQPALFKGKVYANNVAAPETTPKNKRLDWDNSITDIKGRILDKNDQPVALCVVTLYSSKQLTLFDSDTTNKEGQFIFHLPAYPDSMAFTLQVSNLKGKKINDKIIVDAPSPFPKFATPLALKRKLPLQQTAQIQHFRDQHLDNLVLGTGKEWLKEVIVRGKKKENSYNASKRVSNFSYILTGDRILQTNPVEAGSALLTVPGLHLKGGFLTLGGLTSFGASSKDEPLLIVDGVRVPVNASPALLAPLVGSNSRGPIIELASSSSAISGSPVLQEIAKIPPDVIDFIEVLKGPEAAYYGTSSSNGVIIVNTNRMSNYARKIESYGTLIYTPTSYHYPPLFSMPDYSDQLLKRASFKDNRSTLYWNGHVYSNPNGKATIEFYAADPATTYTVTVTGVTAAGDIIYKKTKIKRI